MSISDMGCGTSAGVSEGAQPSLTEKEQTLVKESWATFTDGDIVENGAHLYYKLFEKNPEAKKYFGFAKDQDVSLENRQFLAHVKKVFAVVGSAVDELDNLPGILPILNELGVKHKTYGVPIKYYENIGVCLIYAIDRKAKMDADTKRAWGRVYSVIASEMKKGHA